MSTPDVKPCPKCGSEVVLGGYFVTNRIVCEQCGIQMFHENPRVLVDRWNDRPDTAAERVIREAYRFLLGDGNPFRGFLILHDAIHKLNRGGRF